MELVNEVLVRQVDIALRKLEAELMGMSAGTIVLQVRDNKVGRFGIRHLPFDYGTSKHEVVGMNAGQVKQLRSMAIESLQRKSVWTHGEIAYDFVLKQGKIYISVLFESNYNMANLMIRPNSKHHHSSEIYQD